MKIILSPAKSLNFKFPLPTKEYSHPLFLKEAESINRILKKKSATEISSLMKISEKLANLNVGYHRDFNLPFTLKNARPAIFAFDGHVYTGLDAYSLKENQNGNAARKTENTIGSLWNLEAFGFDSALPIGDGHKIES